MKAALDSRIAIIGMAGRFPDASNLEEFWKNIAEGKESLTEFSEAELLECGVEPDLIRHPSYVRRGTVIEGSDLFDAGFFGFTPKEAAIMDPQHRMFLECAWHAVEDAGYAGDESNRRVGVYAGASMNTYIFSNLMQNPEVLQSVGGYQAMLGNDKDFLSTRVSYKLNLRGPSLTIQTACSTSLVAIRTACQALLDHDCDMALSGGVSLHFPQKAGYLHEEGMILSSDGHCRPFDADASGTRAGQGCAVIALKRMEDALRDGDSIRAVIRGAGVNNDGASKMGYTAPSVEGQDEAIRMALEKAGVDPATISYVEAHGTATRLGDPIEIAALEKVFRSFTARKQFCAIGSLKSNIGHLDAAAGVAGLVKTVLALEHRKIPPSLGFRTPNPLIRFEDSPFYVNDKLADWQSPEPLRAGVSSFGIGGTNAHVVLEEAPRQTEQAVRWPAHLLVLSARTASGLEAANRNLREFLDRKPDVSLADVCYTLQAGRKAFPHRRAFVCSTRESAIEGLGARGKEGKPSGEAAHRPLTFMFSGQGSQYPGMARGLYETEPAFRKWFDICSDGLVSGLGCDLREQLYSPAADGEALNRTRLAQAALFAVEYSLARMWMSWGVQPDSMLGHSIGEYTAACIAGVFSLEDALRLVEARGRIMQSMPAGSMLAVPLNHEQVTGLLNADLALAAVNSASLCTVSGSDEAIRKFQARLGGTGVECRLLHTSHAFHSHMMDSALDPFLESVREIRLSAPRIPFLSNVTGDWITEGEATDPRYWADHLRRTVRFGDGIRRAASGAGHLFLEVGPGQALCTFARESVSTVNGGAFPSLPHAKDGRPELPFILNTVGKLWEAGIPIDWAALHNGERLRRVSLPGYPFERQRHFVDPQRASSPRQNSAPGKIESEAPARQSIDKQGIDKWFYVPSWTRSAPPSSVAGRGDHGPWLIFKDRNGLADAVAAALLSRGERFITVEPAEKFQRLGASAFGIDPAAPEQYRSLLTNLDAAFSPRSILFLWGLPGSLPGGGRAAFHSMLRLAQSLGDGFAGRALDWLVVTAAAHDVTGREEIDPEQALVLGPVKVIPCEYPGVTCRGIDLRNSALSMEELSSTADNLLLEPGMPSSLQIVAYRDGHRWERTYVSAPLAAAADAPTIRRQGAWLVTGGTGGIGLTLAEHLALKFQARLALTCRTTLPPREQWRDWVETHGASDRISRILQSVERIEGHGAEVLVLTADVSDADSMGRAVREAREHFGKIHGVVHAAGIALGGLIQLKTRESAESVLAPKVDGTLILASLFKEDPLDFFILCSSVNAIAGAAGAVDYCAANLFLDAFAAARHRKPHRIVSSLNWDAWQEVGMAANTLVPADMAESWQKHLAQGIKPAEGVEAFLRALNAGLPQIAIVTRDLQAMLKREQTERAPRDAGKVGIELMNGHAANAAFETPAVIGDPVSDTQERIAAIWRELLGIDQVDVDSNFFELGGHSLLATRVLSRVRNTFGLSVPLQVVFDAPTIRLLSEYVDTLLWATTAPAPSPSDLREELEF